MKQLHLNLIKIWFDKILSIEKKEEYREIKPFWCSRFLLYMGKHRSVKWWAFVFEFEPNPTDIIISNLEDEVMTFKKFDTIVFSNGMKPVDILPRFEVEFMGFEIRHGHINIGAIKDKRYFVLKLGKIKSKNCCITQSK